MKKFTDYLTEAKKEYEFRLKFAYEVNDAFLDKLEMALSKYNVLKVGKMSKTILQKQRLDFNHLPPCEVYIIDVTVEYPTTDSRMKNYLCNALGISQSMMVVRNKNHPEEIMAELDEKEEGKVKDASLLDSDYPVYDQEDYYGDEYNKKMVDDELAKRKEKMFNMIQFEKGTDSAASKDTQKPITKSKSVLS